MKYINVLLFTCLLFSGGCCALKSKEQYFKDNMNYWIGQGYNNAKQYLWEVKEGPRKLESGDLEFIHRRSQDCEVAITVSGKTNRITGWRYLDDPKRCQIEPCGAW